MQLTIYLGTNHPYDRVVSAIRCCNPGRTLTALVGAPSERYCRRTRRCDLVGLNFATSAKNEVCSLPRSVSGRRLAPEGAIDTERRYRSGDSAKVVTVNQISIAVFTQGEN